MTINVNIQYKLGPKDKSLEVERYFKNSNATMSKDVLHHGDEMEFIIWGEVGIRVNEIDNVTEKE